MWLGGAQRLTVNSGGSSFALQEQRCSSPSSSLKSSSSSSSRVMSYGGRWAAVQTRTQGYNRCSRSRHVESRRAEGQRSLYHVLRVHPDASSLEIKVAYRTLAKLYHPDAFSSIPHSTQSIQLHSQDDGGRDFMQIHTAYATLSDPAARALYDLSLGGPVVPGVGPVPPFHHRPTRRWETDQCW